MILGYLLHMAPKPPENQLRFCFPKFLDFAANPGATNQEFDEALFIFYFSIHIIDYPCIFTYMII